MSLRSWSIGCSDRATIASGLYPHQQWLLQTRTTSGPSLQPAFPTYGKLLRQLGYHAGDVHDLDKRDRRA